MQPLRTPDARFVGLPDFPFAPHYTEIANPGGPSLRIHYLDEGPPSSAPVLLLHGEPSWRYLYRHMIPSLAARGHRVLAPDLVGFGRSDKPALRTDYTFERHVDWMSTWLTALDLRDITLFCQDWGGLIGLRLVARFPEHFARVVAANTGLPVGDGKAPLAFRLWVAFSQLIPRFPVGWLVSKGTVRGLTAPEKAAYDAPFPDESYKHGGAAIPVAGPGDGRACFGSRLQAGLAGSFTIRQAVPHRVQRRRPDHAGRRSHLPGTDSRRQRPASHNYQACRPLSAGRPVRKTCRTHRSEGCGFELKP